jgi:hypothetical protein
MIPRKIDELCGPDWPRHEVEHLCELYKINPLIHMALNTLRGSTERIFFEIIKLQHARIKSLEGGAINREMMRPAIVMDVEEARRVIRGEE